MKKQDFLKKIEVELKISKSSKYTRRNYLNANKKFLESTTKAPDKVDEDDIKLYLAETCSDASAMSIMIWVLPKLGRDPITVSSPG